MTTFGLVHGAYHGAWCWDLLAAELERSGHRCVAMDLPVSDATAGASRYAGVVVSALGELDDVVLVGHSLAGLVIPMVAAARRVSRLVYLCALLPQPGASFDEAAAGQGVFAAFRPSVRAVANPDGSTTQPQRRAIELSITTARPPFPSGPPPASCRSTGWSRAR